MTTLTHCGLRFRVRGWALVLALTGVVSGATAAETPDAGPVASLLPIDAEATNFSYPFPVSFLPLTAQRQVLRLAYMDVSPSGRPNGRTVLLLHGKNFSGAYWEPTIRALASQGYRVIAPDQIGFGKSTKPQAFQFTFQALADSTHALLASLNIHRVVVVGHSMGGMLAVRFTLMFPNEVEKLVLVNPLGLEDWKTVVPYRTIDQAYAEELRATPESIRNYQRTSYYAGHWEQAYEKLIALQAGWTLHAEYPRVAWCAALTSDMIFTQPVIYEFPLVRAPTLLIIGQRDRTAIGKGWVPADVGEKLGDYPSLGRKAAAAIPGARLVEIEGVGHLPQVEAFDRYSEALLTFIR
jgi:pimeloyl-ACP methyl ester carboxylesterase